MDDIELLEDTLETVDDIGYLLDEVQLSSEEKDALINTDSADNFQSGII